MVEFQMSFVGKAADDASSAIRRTPLSVGSTAAPIPPVSDCFHQTAGPEGRERHPPPRHSFQVIIMDVRGFTGERLRVVGGVKGPHRGFRFKSVSGVCLTAVP